MTYNPVSRKHFPCNSSVAADINSSSFVICATFGLDLDIPDVYIELRGNGNSDARAPSVTRYTSKAYAILGIIKRNFDHIGKDAIFLYKSMVRSHLEFSNSVWSPHNIGLTEKI